ncbi:MAG TPA: hypothetical protein PKE26_05125 [Kiritimatiellia bacterium]|nr:hypothetical protein [Kiritimatiellia bacterium]HMO98474.1 hypothetical protein [Kiritimatiellia bacterium]HMP96515.1 hypothetical protein [Kiritimatiellia bacterium]
MNHAIPLYMKEVICQEALRLPVNKRRRFVTRAITKAARIAKDHPQTIAYTVIGLIIGEILDNVLTIPLPFTDRVLELTGDAADKALGAAGAIWGFGKDRKRLFKNRQQVSERKEFERMIKATITDVLRKNRA